MDARPGVQLRRHSRGDGLSSPWGGSFGVEQVTYNLRSPRVAKFWTNHVISPEDSSVHPYKLCIFLAAPQNNTSASSSTRFSCGHCSLAIFQFAMASCRRFSLARDLAPLAPSMRY